MCVNPKYNIKRLLALLPGDNRTNKYLLLIELNIADSTLRKWIDTELSDRFDIPVEQFYKLCAFLKCLPTDLTNTKLPTLTSSTTNG